MPRCHIYQSISLSQAKSLHLQHETNIVVICYTTTKIIKLSMTATENNDGILPKIYVIYNRRKTKKGKKKYIMKTYSANAPNITTNITSQLKRRKKKSSPKIR